MKCLTSEAINTQSRYTERNMLQVKKYRKVYSSHTCSPEDKRAKNVVKLVHGANIGVMLIGRFGM